MILNALNFTPKVHLQCCLILWQLTTVTIKLYLANLKIHSSWSLEKMNLLHNICTYYMDDRLNYYSYVMHTIWRRLMCRKMRKLTLEERLRLALKMQLWWIQLQYHILHIWAILLSKHQNFKTSYFTKLTSIVLHVWQHNLELRSCYINAMALVLTIKSKWSKSITSSMGTKFNRNW